MFLNKFWNWYLDTKCLVLCDNVKRVKEQPEAQVHLNGWIWMLKGTYPLQGVGIRHGVWCMQGCLRAPLHGCSVLHQLQKPAYADHSNYNGHTVADKMLLEQCAQLQIQSPYVASVLRPPHRFECCIMACGSDGCRNKCGDILTTCAVILYPCSRALRQVI